MRPQIAAITILEGFLFLLQTASAYNNVRNEAVSLVLNLITSGSKYDKRLRPEYDGNPTSILVALYIVGISAVSEFNMDFTVDFDLLQMWPDPRLQFNESGLAKLIVGSEFLRKELWLPDTFIINQKYGGFQTNAISNEFVSIWPDGFLAWDVRQTVSSHCEMNLILYPFDTQECFLKIGSKTKGRVSYWWWEGVDSWRTESSLNVSAPAQFKVLGWRNSKAGNDLQWSILLTRSIVYFIFRIYLPCALIVVISFLPLWFNESTRNERVAIGITSLLALTTFISFSNAELPKISYITAMDVYLFSCFTFVFGAVLKSSVLVSTADQRSSSALESAMTFLTRATEMASRSSRPPRQGWAWKGFGHRCCRRGTSGGRGRSGRVVVASVMKPLKPSADSGSVEKGKGTIPVSKPKIMPTSNYAKVIFPVSFFCFNVIYMAVYAWLSSIDISGYNLNE